MCAVHRFVQLHFSAPHMCIQLKKVAKEENIYFVPNSSGDTPVTALGDRIADGGRGKIGVPITLQGKNSIAIKLK